MKKHPAVIPHMHLHCCAAVWKTHGARLTLLGDSSALPPDPVLAEGFTTDGESCERISGDSADSVQLDACPTESLWYSSPYLLNVGTVVRKDGVCLGAGSPDGTSGSAVRHGASLTNVQVQPTQVLSGRLGEVKDAKLQDFSLKTRR